jgi:hypothetical protein
MLATPDFYKIGGTKGGIAGLILGVIIDFLFVAPNLAM